MPYYLDWTIERDEETFDVEIEYEYKFGAPASWTDPADPDELEITKVRRGRKPCDITDAEAEKIEQYIYNNPPDDDYDDYYSDD